jgi:hypothetical protein
VAPGSGPLNLAVGGGLLTAEETRQRPRGWVEDYAIQALKARPAKGHFAGVFRNLGMTPAQIEAAIAWGAGFDGKPEDALPQFENFCEQQGIARELADFGISWHAQVCERGIEAMPEPPSPGSSPQQDAARLAEIEAEMRKPRGDRQYWKDPELRDEYLAILQRAEGRAGQPASSPADAARKAEIEQILRTDRARYEQTGLDREYLAILERESGEAGLPPPQMASDRAQDITENR